MDGSDRDFEDDAIYQNYSASEVFIQGVAGMVSQDDVGRMVQAQKEMLQRFEKTNAMLSNVNNLSSVRLDRANKDFRKHSQNVLEMKKDLEIVFRRLRSIKEKLKTQCPEAYSEVIGAKEEVKEEDDEYDTAIKAQKAQEHHDSGSAGADMIKDTSNEAIDP